MYYNNPGYTYPYVSSPNMGMPQMYGTPSYPNNPMTPQVPVHQQQPQPQGNLISVRVVSNPDEITPQEIPMDGTTTVPFERSVIFLNRRRNRTIKMELIERFL